LAARAVRGTEAALVKNYDPGIVEAIQNVSLALGMSVRTKRDQQFVHAGRSDIDVVFDGPGGQKAIAARFEIKKRLQLEGKWKGLELKTDWGQVRTYLHEQRKWLVGGAGPVSERECTILVIAENASALWGLKDNEPFLLKFAEATTSSDEIMFLIALNLIFSMERYSNGHVQVKAREAVWAEQSQFQGVFVLPHHVEKARGPGSWGVRDVLERAMMFNTSVRVTTYVRVLRAGQVRHSMKRFREGFPVGIACMNGESHLARRAVTAASVDQIERHFVELAEGLVEFHRWKLAHGDARHPNSCESDDGAVWIDPENAVVLTDETGEGDFRCLARMMWVYAAEMDTRGGGPLRELYVRLACGSLAALDRLFERVA
jgi:hypothetical protein